ncbi:phage tail protein [Escherichia coli]|uniref:Phage tail protein n=1 Tax=Escherichia coli TaxID=562 RepID=A0A6L7FBR1_ECOLX|nr:phage tail protein [Escherichia coli]MXI74463.1 phage tail protein [Escherichia coli]MXJ25894.1 phage tail protein [Escherichia coli]MXJ72019.1 phage tail protein [Escherichia coli]
MPQLKGVIKTPTGEPLGGATITLTSLHNRAGILKSVFSHVTTQNGEYDFPVLPGVYSVRLTQSTQRLSEIGVIRVYEDSTDGSLNDFLGATDIDLRPEALKKFEELAQQAQQSAEAAAESEQQAAQHVTDAQKIKDDCQTLANDVQKNAEAVAASKQQVEQLASQVEDTAEEVRQNAEAAKQAASDAEQARDDIDVALSATLKTANHLSEIAAEGEDAQQESRDNLGLKSAATMDVQTDIYNRTEGCVALPGAFGYGAYPTQRKEFDKYATSATFASWVQTTPPGRYLVVQYGGPYSKDIIEGVVFSGEVEIKMLETATHENQNRRDKFVIFNGVNQDVYCCEVRAGSTNIRWTCLSQNLTAIDGARWLYSIAGPWYDVPFRDVAVGGLTQAAYRAANTDEYTIKRGDSVSGSTLIPCAVIVSNNGAPRYVLDTGRHFSGSYVSLGNSTQATSDFIFGLFVRVS